MMAGPHHILQAGPLPPMLASRLHTLAPVTVLEAGPGRAAQLAALAADAAQATVLVTTGTQGADAALMAALPQLQAICSLGVGYDTIDVEAARERGIVVSNTPGVLDDCVADLAMGLMIDAMRGISASDRHIRSGNWPLQGPTPPATRMSGKRLGLLGMGRIGQAIARRAEGFGMPIRYHARHARPALAWAHEPSLLALAGWSDVLVVACTGGPQTHHLVDAAVIDALGPRGWLVNIARGSVVDEAALVDALQRGALAGAGLDVFEDEPQVPEALRAMAQVVLTTHIGSGTQETRAAMVELVLDNLRSYLQSGRLVTPV